jgi:hypothetical protein
MDKNEKLRGEIKRLENQAVVDRASANNVIAETLRKFRESEERCNRKEAELEALRAEKRRVDAASFQMQNSLRLAVQYGRESGWYL